MRFGTTVTKVLRNAADDGWNLHITARDSQPQVLPFHKFVLASGSDTIAAWPDMPGRHLFRGRVLHSQDGRVLFLIMRRPNGELYPVKVKLRRQI